MIRDLSGGSGRSESRSIKKTIDAQSSRASRQETTLEIRKQKKEQKRKSRRDTTPQNYTTPKLNVNTAIYKCKEIGQWWATDPMAHAVPFFEAIRSVRRFLSADDPPVAEVLQAGILEYFHQALKQNDEEPNLQLEAAWALTNIASSRRTADVAEFPGMVDELVRLLLQGRTAAVREQCAWCLGNIGGDEKKYRHGLLNMQDVRQGFVVNMTQPETQSLLENMVWAVSNLVRDSAELGPMATKCFVGPLIRILGASEPEQEELRTNILYCLLYLAEFSKCESEHDRGQILLDFGVLLVLMKVLEEALKMPQCAPIPLLIPLVRCLGMFVAGNDSQVDAVLDAGFLNHVPKLLRLRSNAVRKETLWALSNIAAGTAEQASQVASNRKVMFMLADSAKSNQWAAKKEALWTMCHLLNSRIPDHAKAVKDCGAVLPLCEGLKVNETDLLLNILNGFDVLFEHAAKTEDGHCHLAFMLEEEGGIDQIESLTDHRDNEVYDKATKIIETWLGTNNDDEPPMTEDSTLNDSSSLTFGFSQPRELFPTGPKPTFEFSGMIA